MYPFENQFTSGIFKKSNLFIMKNLLLLLSLFLMACGSDSGDSDTDNNDNGSSALSIEETKEGLKKQFDFIYGFHGFYEFMFSNR